jgi:hypothetical protein
VAQFARTTVHLAADTPLGAPNFAAVQFPHAQG